jgi:uncharacterized peroxidase-related enzyme
MAYIDVVAEESATGLLSECFAADRRSWGFLPNLATTFGVKPEVYQAWRQLNGAIRGSMDLRRYELVTFVAAAELRSSYCALAHGRILAREFMSEEEVIGLVTNPDSVLTDPIDRAVVALTRKVVRAATEVTDQDIAAVRHEGLTDEEILEVVLTASARCFFSKTLDATGTAPDAAFARLNPALRDALTVGRPIAPDRAA